MQALADHADLAHRELDRISNSATFARSPILRKLLAYLVYESLAGNGDKLKAYTIAVDGLGRGEDFDPQVDSYPRVQVGRLRKLLDLFYGAEGFARSERPYRLVIPVGSYRVMLEWQARAADKTQPAVIIEGDADAASDQAEPADAATQRYAMASARHGASRAESAAAAPLPSWARDGGRPLSHAMQWVSIGLIGCFAVAFTFFLLRGGPWSSDETSDEVAALADGPSVYITAEEGGGSDDPLVEQAVRMIEMRMVAFGRLHVMGANDDAEPREYRPGSYKLEVGRGDGDMLFLTLRRLNDGATIWSRELPLAEGGGLPIDQLAVTIAQIAHNFGVIATDQRTLLGDSHAPGYPCLLQYDEYRRYRTAEEASQVRACLDKSLALAPQDPEILQAVSYVTFNNADYNLGHADRKAGLQYANRALVLLGRESAAANMALARAGYFTGNCTQGLSYGERAAELNPLDPDNLALLAAYSFGCGQYDRAGELIDRSLALDPSGSELVWGTQVFLAVHDGRNAEALRIARQMTRDDNHPQPAYHMAQTMAYAANGQRAKARMAWQALLKSVGEKPDAPPAKVLKSLLNSQSTIDQAVAQLHKAGIA